MKKSLLTLAILSAFAATASAQSSVTLYGIVDAGLAYEDTGAVAGKTIRFESGGQSTSRFGLRGAEDLGGGLQALFQLESGFVQGTGVMSGAATGQLFNRQSWVGLKGDFGTLRLGRQEAPIYAAFNKGFDPFGRGLAGNIERMFPTASTRISNTIGYTTPTFGGFSADLSLTPGGVAGSTSQGREIGVSGQYVQGPFGVILAHHNTNSTPVAPAAIVNTQSNFLAGTYDFGPAKGYLAYGTNKNDHTTAASRLNTRSWLIGVTVPHGPHTFIADYIRKTDKEFANRDAGQFALGYTYAWSKRTNLYAAYAQTNNQSAGLTNVVTAGATYKLLHAGLRHQF